MNTSRSLAVLFLLFLAACDSADNAADISADSSADKVQEPILSAAKIHWFDGSVEQGFEFAKAENKPVYLYWGAVWCPPCQEIKNTVFKSKQFITQTEPFVPIYLDGDMDHAQTWGDKFGVKGYPTMIVFNPDGEEVTRIPGGIELSRYNSVLALSLAQMRPTTMLVDLAINNPDKLQPSDFVQLAYYSWGQDSNSLPEGAPATLFSDLSDKSSDEEASARLYMEYLVALSRELEPNDSELTLDREAGISTGAFERVAAILDSPKLTLACWDSLAYYAEEIAALTVFSDEELVKLRGKWQAQLVAMRHQPSLSTAEQVAGWLPLLTFHFMENGEAPLEDSIITDLKDDLTRADEKESNSFARQSVVNRINHIYQSARLYDEAHALLLAELDRSESPYYFMSSLSSLAEEQEKTAEAVEWSRKAYEASTGAATRFQWGASYIKTIIRLAPENNDLIVKTSIDLFAELKDGQSVFSGRNFRVLRSLSRQLSEWQDGKLENTLIETFHARVQSMCEKQAPATMELTNCRSLLSS
ncbi:MAG: hypothetical protein CMQ19_08195 [Gammaproteobacteria bacterium]|nr:hypothetical protein [Gammaproteobacteria bacterium]